MDNLLESNLASALFPGFISHTGLVLSGTFTKFASPVQEITVGHWLFSDQFQHLTSQNLCWLAKFTVPKQD